MYYIYILVDLNNLPFYVGVGKKNRKSHCTREESHIAEARRYLSNGRKRENKKLNFYKLNVICSILDTGHEVRIMYDNYYDLEKDAFKRETELIKYFGRRDLKTGILTNLTDGGEGIVNPGPETRNKIAAAQTGRKSPLKGKKIGKYSQERKDNAKTGLRKFWNEITDEDRELRKNSRSWAPLTQEHKDKISTSLTGRPSPMKGKTGWNKGLTKETSPSVAKNAANGSATKQAQVAAGTFVAHNKGKSSPRKGKTYEEIYDAETAKRMRAIRKATRWLNNGIKNKKVKTDDTHQWLSAGWVLGRLPYKSNPIL